MMRQGTIGKLCVITDGVLYQSNCIYHFFVDWSRIHLRRTEFATLGQNNNGQIADGWKRSLRSFYLKGLLCILVSHFLVQSQNFLWLDWRTTNRFRIVLKFNNNGKGNTVWFNVVFMFVCDVCCLQMLIKNAE